MSCVNMDHCLSLLCLMVIEHVMKRDSLGMSHKIFTALFCLSSDPTLTTHNVMEMMKGVSYGMLRRVLTASFYKRSEILTQYQSDDQRSEALISHTISTHPCLSWNLLASGLQRCGYSEAAAEVTRKYVKGKFINHGRGIPIFVFFLFAVA